MKKTGKNKYIWLTVGGIMLLLALGGGYFLCHSNVSFSLGTQNVNRELFELVMQEEISQTVAYFNEKGKHSADKNYWVSEYQGEVPYEVLAAKTMDRLRELAAIYELAEKSGTPMQGGLEKIPQRMQAENADRQKKIEQNQPIFGLKNFSFHTYLEYETDYLQKQYCSNPQNEGMQVSEQERKEYYEKNKEMMFRKNDDIDLQYLKIDTSEMSEDEILQTKQMLQQLKSSTVGLLEESVEEFPTLKEDLEVVEIASEEAASYTRLIGDVMDYAAELQPKQMTEVIFENGYLYLIQCTDRTKQNFIPLEEVTDHINKAIREQRYNQMVEQTAQELVFSGDENQILAFVKKQMK